MLGLCWQIQEPWELQNLHSAISALINLPPSPRCWALLGAGLWSLCRWDWDQELPPPWGASHGLMLGKRTRAGMQYNGGGQEATPI